MKMNKQLGYVLFLLWFSYLLISSILLFTKGFLLTRVVQKNNSSCLLLNNVSCPDEQSILSNISNKNIEQCSQNEKIATILSDVRSASRTCLPPKSKVVLLIVDALRYDFTLYDKDLADPLPYQNKLPIIGKLREIYPNSTRLYKFMADPPTTTMQRLKAITTGSLPTFIDAGSNFATSEINEDNLIDQMNRNNYSVVFMGDDTWSNLFPNRFLRNYPFPSFDVWDLDTVDNGVVFNLFPELKNKDWNLLIGHLLGVDHAGHKHGPNHPEMSRKLTEVNEIIEKVVHQLDDNTMLFVIGDHGMTSTGDHGGATEEETTAGMFVFSKKPLISVGSIPESVKQVDLVPTLSTILGVPIPFQNLGILISNCIPITNKNTLFEEWQLTLYSLWSNILQMYDYINIYSHKTKSFKEEILNIYKEKYSILNGKMHSVKNEDMFEEFSKEITEYLLQLRIMCEEVWVQFDSFSMTRGMLFIFLTMFFTYLIIDGMPTKSLPEIFQSPFILCAYGSLFITAFLVAVLFYFKYIDNLTMNIFFANGLISQFMLAILIIQNWDVISENWHEKAKSRKVSNSVCRFVLLLNLIGLFSNSYIIEESFVLLYLLVSVILGGTLGISTNSANLPTENKKKNVFSNIRWSKPKLYLLAMCIAALVRCTMYFWRCRAEQQWCFSTPSDINLITAKLESTKFQYILTLVCIALFVFATKAWLRECGNLNGYAVNVILAKYMPTVLVVCITAYWGINKIPSQQTRLINPYQMENYLAWVVYGFTYFGIVSIVSDPLCVYILANKGVNVPQVDTEANVIPQLFNKIKKSYSETRNKDDIPIVCGLGTIYSAVYVILGVYLCLIFTLLLGDSVAPSAVIMFFTAAFVLIITSVLRIEHATTIESLFNIPNIQVLIWVILSQYFFYGSGHQATFPNINWDAAFVGLKGINIYNYIPAILVIINTFCSYILMGFFLPLIVIAPFNVFVMIPSVIGKKHELLTASQRGEVLLYERDDTLFATTFTLACKYIMCHGLRVFASMLSATIHCRHLMVWSIFAPKLIFECIGMIVTLVSVFCGYLILLRINKKVDALVVQLNKLK